MNWGINMKTKNAGLKSMKEAIQGMIDGEVYYTGSTTETMKIWFNKAHIDGPLRIGGASLCQSLHRYPTWMVAQPWYENIPNEGVPCWVSDNSCQPDEKTQIALIDTRIEGDMGGEGYFMGDGVSWNYATPITKEELLS